MKTVKTGQPLRRSTPSTQRRRMKSRARVPVDAEVCGALVSLAILLCQCGYSARKLSELTAAIFGSIPSSLGAGATGLDTSLEDPAQVLTLWFSLRKYIRNGRPRPLPLVGPEPSLEALAHRVNPNLKVTQVVAELRRAQALKKDGQYYVPVKRWVSYRRPRTRASHQLRATIAFLANQEHNLRPARKGSWFHRVAESPAFPVRALPELDAIWKKRMGALLEDMDDYMERRGLTRRPEEPTARVGVGGWRYQTGDSTHSREYLRILSKVRGKLKPSKPRIEVREGGTGGGRR
jgi:hypothetical protein